MTKESKFVRNDIVVLKSSNEETVIEKHLFQFKEYLGGTFDKVLIKSMITGVEITREVEAIRYPTLKELYLRDNNSVVVDGVGYLVSGDKLVGADLGYAINTFDEDMIIDTGSVSVDIVFTNPNASFASKIDPNHALSKEIWNRKSLTIELTDDEKIILKHINSYIERIRRNTKGFIVGINDEGEEFRLFCDSLFYDIKADGTIYSIDLLLDK